MNEVTRFDSPFEKFRKSSEMLGVKVLYPGRYNIGNVSRRGTKAASLSRGRGE